MAHTEVSMLQDYNWQEASLGSRILRAETAAIAAVTLLQGISGNM